MKIIFFFFILLFTIYTNSLFAQADTCNLIGTKWRIKKVDIKRTEGSIDDSISKKVFYRKFDSVLIHFNSKKKITVSWRQYRILGTYKVKQTLEGKVLVFTKWKHFGFYENGSLERSEFAVFLYPFKKREIPFLRDCSFKMLAKSREIECEVLYNRIE
jgi:hypothetical protein